ncbi:hypothetical protein JOB18_013868 [Solea senegalensis]|uniref:DUF5641 domain-containing protein n=1 Tax=Solea senegalensis TaxID=28829 RepID=A0AAV6T514_SOLSE|nr:hypothetical protein JOB18_013868 [Solea senegalensis]
MEREKREIKLTAKAMENKIERSQHERKGAVNKIKELIPQIKTHMKSKENVTEIPSQLNNLNALCKKATDLHNEVLQLLPDDEHKKQKEWFSSIMDYSDAFKEQVEKWIKENPHENSNELPLQTNTSEQPTKEINYAEQIPVEKKSAVEEQVGLSREDLRFMDMVTKSAKHVNGHYQVALPLKNPNVSMPNNRKVVEQRQTHLKRRLQRDPVFYREYNTFINDLLGKGYAEKVPDAELERSDGRVWYIPHHGVYHPTKGKLRVVFDCGASYKGQSLNEELLQGPDLTSSLIGVVTRFRREPVVIMADLFWKRWTKEYLPLLQERQRWTGVQRNLVAGDLVLLMDSTAPRNSWIMGRVLQTFPDRKGFVRQIRIKTRTSCLDRPISKMDFALIGHDDQKKDYSL